jgi:hypothetical protein
LRPFPLIDFSFKIDLFQFASVQFGVGAACFAALSGVEMIARFAVFKSDHPPPPALPGSCGKSLPLLPYDVVMAAKQTLRQQEKGITIIALPADRQLPKTPSLGR